MQHGPEDHAADARLSIGLIATALIAMTITRCWIGATLGTAFLPLFIAPILAAYLPNSRPLKGMVIVLSLALASTLPLWGIASPGQWCQLLILTFTCILLIEVSASALRRLGWADAFAQTLVLLTWIAWLTWPIWLAGLWVHPNAAPWLDRLLPFNPIAAIGGTLVSLGDWTHQPIAYRYLLNLGQDVPYEPPLSAWPAIAAHLALAILLIAPQRWRFDASVDLPTGEE